MLLSTHSFAQRLAWRAEALWEEHRNGERRRNVKSIGEGDLKYGGWGRGGHKKGETWRETVKSVIQGPSGVGRILAGPGHWNKW